MTELPIHRGKIVLTETHLQVERDARLKESHALKHISDVTIEETHSFRHRVFGLLAGLSLLITSLIVILPQHRQGDVVFHGRGTEVMLFMAFMGIVFLIAVLRSRVIWWLRFRYAGVSRFVPLPEVEYDTLEHFRSILQKAIDQCPLPK